MCFEISKGVFGGTSVLEESGSRYMYCDFVAPHLEQIPLVSGNQVRGARPAQVSCEQNISRHRRTSHAEAPRSFIEGDRPPEDRPAAAGLCGPESDDGALPVGRSGGAARVRCCTQPRSSAISFGAKWRAGGANRGRVAPRIARSRSAIGPPTAKPWRSWTPRWPSRRSPSTYPACGNCLGPAQRT
jgi:hypothetical protein